jgi:NADH:ubiquinone oxidoreductase subunit F (NADH-binding)
VKAPESQLTARPPAPDGTSLPRLLATAGDPSLHAHIDKWGEVPASYLDLREVDRAGLRGRGGAWFPTVRKLATVASGRRPIVVANGTEREPISNKDKTILTAAPHLVLDGIGIAAGSVGAERAVLCIDRSDAKVIRSVQRAVAERAAGDAVPVSIKLTPSRYVAGEESALVHWLNGGQAKPTFVPPRPFERGVDSRPTLVNNVETLANLALIARFGARWFRGLGTAEDPGTLLATVTGDVEKPGVYELAFGSSVDSLLRVTGADRSAHAVLTGGLAGTWVPAAIAAKLTWDRKSFAAADATIGCASLVVAGGASCGLALTARIAHWMGRQTAGQCGPCVNGLPSIAGALDALVAGDRAGRWEAQLRKWLDLVEGRGACHHPDGVVRMVRSALSVFSDEIESHRRHGPCGARSSTPISLPSWKGPWQ